MIPREPPEQTLARLLPLASGFGVTRLGVLTGLDTIGIPVAAAFRPNSRTVSVHQGKGASLAQAKVSALMEALECHCAETQRLPLQLGTAAEMAALGSVTDVRRLPRCAGAPDPAGQRLLWVEGRELMSAQPIWVPRELVAADFSTPLAPDSGVFQATTNGLASGCTEGQAILHGLCEVIERDAVCLWLGSDEASQAERLVEPDSVDGPAALAMLQRCRAADLEVVIWDVTSDLAMSAFLVLLTDPLDRIQAELGAACRPDPDSALAAALAEAAQARATTISGARDDMTPESFEPSALRARAQQAAVWRGVAPRRRFDTVAACDGADPVVAVLGRLAMAGMEQAACVTLTRPDIGLPVVRVVVPGLEGPWTEPGGEYFAGARAKRRS